jgi:hypothetical protein
MMIDKDAAAVEAAALDFAADMTRNMIAAPLGLRRDSAALRALMATAFIAGHSHAKRDTVLQFDQVLAPQVRP